MERTEDRIIHKFVYIVIILFLGLGVLKQGFLYELDYLFANVFLGASFLICCFTLKQVRFHLIHLFLFLIVILYWLSVFIATDMEKAILEAIKLTTLLPFSMLVSMLSKEQVMKVFRWIPYMGGFLVVVGVVFQMERQNRLESTIGYANALAIFLLISLLMTFFFYVKNARNSDFILMIIQAVGLLLTFSRSVWVLWLVSVAALALLQEFRKRDIWLKIVSVHLIGFVATALLKRDILFFWLRLKTIQPETSEFRMRLVYWNDSLPMIADHFWLGTGGGGWSVQQTLYHSEEYFVRFIHNHYLQIALDIGISGFVLFISIILFFYYKSFILIKSVMPSDVKPSILWVKGIVLMSTVLLIHAGFDFDLSFLLLFAVFLVFVEYIMGQSPGTATVLMHPSKSVKAILSISLVAMLLFTSLVTVGKYMQMRGQNHVANGDLLSAIQDYSTAQKLMPWAASAYYDMGKAYVLLGNKTGNRMEYLKGKARAEQAIRRVPHEDLYQNLYDDLSKYFNEE